VDLNIYLWPIMRKNWSFLILFVILSLSAKAEKLNSDTIINRLVNKWWGQYYEHKADTIKDEQTIYLIPNKKEARKIFCQSFIFKDDGSFEIIHKRKPIIPALRIAYKGQWTIADDIITVTFKKQKYAIYFRVLEIKKTSFTTVISSE